MISGLSGWPANMPEPADMTFSALVFELGWFGAAHAIHGDSLDAAQKARRDAVAKEIDRRLPEAQPWSSVKVDESFRYRGGP